MKSKLKIKEEDTANSSKTDNYEELLENEVFTVFDIETSGFSPQKGGEIIELAAVRIVRGRIVDTMSSLIQPEHTIPNKIIQITGITNNMVKVQPLVNEVLDQFSKFAGGSLLVAHNVSFEKRFITYFYDKLGIQVEHGWMCSMKLFRYLYPERKKLGLGTKLGDLVEHYGVALNKEDQHRALADTEATAAAFIEMRKEILDDEFIQEELMLTTDIPLPKANKQEGVDEFNITSVNYWEKCLNKKREQWVRRLYVHFYSPENITGTIYYDLYSNSLNVQKVHNKLTREEKKVDMDAFESQLVEHLGTDSVQVYLIEKNVFKNIQKAFIARTKDKYQFVEKIYPDNKVKHIKHVKDDIPYDVFLVNENKVLVTNEKRGSRYRYYFNQEDIK